MPKKTVKVIIESKNDYIIGVKGNQPMLYKQIQETTSDEKGSKSSSITIEKNKGRLEARRIFVFDNLEGISEEWIGLKRLVRVDREVYSKKRAYTEISYYISSLAINATKFNKGIRSHWGIENKLHWVKDVTFKEDSSKIKTGYAPENMSIIRNIVINVLRKNGYKNLAQATRLLSNSITQTSRLLE